MKKQIDLFFGLENSDTININTSIEERQTFIHLIKTKPEFAFDYINCWFVLKGFKPFTEECFNEMNEYVNMLISTKKVR